MRLKFFQEIVTVLQTITSYQETRVKLTNRKLNKLKFAAKNKAGTILILNKKNWRRRIATWNISNNKKTN